MLLCFECLESILLHTASLQSQSDSGSGMGSSPGHKLLGAILQDHMRPLYSALMTSCPMKLVAACLRLLTAMVMQGRTAARDVQQTFNFSYKPLIVFPNRTNRVKVMCLLHTALFSIFLTLSYSIFPLESHSWKFFYMKLFFFCCWIGLI